MTKEEFQRAAQQATLKHFGNQETAEQAIRDGRVHIVCRKRIRYLMIDWQEVDVSMTDVG